VAAAEVWSERGLAVMLRCVNSAGLPQVAVPDAHTRVVTVVLADDSDLYRRGMRRAIEADSRLALVAEVSDGAAALAAIREHQPDAALLDLQMPALDGVEVGRRLQADPPPRRTRLVLVSAFLAPEAIVRALACGMDYQLEKTTPRCQICDLLAGAPLTEPIA
jgi:two-component system nitrate/nitrite response regulator NarL